MAKKKFFVSLTFDDGWKSAITHAAPLLKRFGMLATFYVISECVEKRQERHMDADDLRTLAAQGHEIGSHTRSHKQLTELSAPKAWDEIHESAEYLRSLGFNPLTFAYPYGDFNPLIVKYVREAGFIAARTIAWGVNDERTNPFLLRAHAVRKEHSAAQVASWILRATQSKGEWLILYFHQIEPAPELTKRSLTYGTTPLVLQDILLFLERESIPVLTVAAGIERLIDLAAA